MFEWKKVRKYSTKSCQIVKAFSSIVIVHCFLSEVFENKHSFGSSKQKSDVEASKEKKRLQKQKKPSNVITITKR